MMSLPRRLEARRVRRDAAPRPARAAGPALLLGLLALAAACTFTPGGAETFQEALTLYEVSDPRKAIALAAAVQGERGRSAWGVFAGALTQDQANEKALEACTENARRAGVDARCYLFAVGDAPAEATVAACRARRIGDYRCELQRRHRSALGGAEPTG